METIRKEIGKHIPRIREYEADYIRYAYAPYYHGIARDFIQSMLEEVIPEANFLPKRVDMEERVQILFGEYMGQADVLFTLGEEAGDEVFQNISG